MSEHTPTLSNEQLKKLSLRAIVAHSSRCAQRVLPVFPYRASYFWGEKKDVQAIKVAALASELFAWDGPGRETEAMLDIPGMIAVMEGLSGSARERKRDHAMDLAAARATAASEAAEAVALKCVSKKLLSAGAVASAASAAAFTFAKAANSRNNPELNPEDVIAQALIADATYAPPTRPTMSCCFR